MGMQSTIFGYSLLFKLSMIGLGPFYHGTNSKFDFKKDFDFAAGVGAIYMFANENIDGGAAYARYVGKDFGQKEAYLYEVYLEPSAKIIDLTQWNEETQKLAALLDSDEDIGRLIPGEVGKFQNKERWHAFAHCTDEFDMPCVFDVLDYNEELFEALSQMGVDGLYFVDGLDELDGDIPDSRVPAIALFNTDVINKVSVYEVETRGNGIKKISEAHTLQNLHEAITLDIDIGDIVLTGKFKNKRTKVKTIGTDELGQPTINGKPILKLRIEKLMPKDKQSKQTRESLDEGFTDIRFKKLAGLLIEQMEPEATPKAEKEAWRDINAWLSDVVNETMSPEEAFDLIMAHKEQFELDRVDLRGHINAVREDLARDKAKETFRRVTKLLYSIEDKIR